MCVAVVHGLGVEGLLAAKVVWGVGPWLGSPLWSPEPSSFPDVLYVTHYLCTHMCVWEGKGPTSLVLPGRVQA